MKSFQGHSHPILSEHISVLTRAKMYFIAVSPPSQFFLSFVVTSSLAFSKLTEEHFWEFLSNGQVELFMTKQFQVVVFEILVVEIRRLFSDEFILSHSAFVFGFWLVISLTRWDPSKFCCFFSPFVVFHRLTFRWVILFRNFLNSFEFLIPIMRF